MVYRWRRTESGDLLSVLDQLNPDTLSDSGVGLLGLNTDLLEDDTLGVGGATERRGLVGGSEEALLVVEIGPSSLATMVAELAGGVETSRLSCGFLSVSGRAWWFRGSGGRAAMQMHADGAIDRVACVPLPMIAVLSWD